MKLNAQKSISELQEEIVNRIILEYGDTYNSVEQIAKDLKVPVKLVRKVVNSTFSRSYRSEVRAVRTLDQNKSNFFFDSQVEIIMRYYNTFAISVRGIAARPEVYLPVRRVQQVIESNTTKEQRESRRVNCIRSHGGLDLFSVTRANRASRKHSSYLVELETINHELTKQQQELKSLLDTTSEPLIKIARMMGIPVNECVSLASQVYTQQQLAARSKRLHYRELDSHF